MHVVFDRLVWIAVGWQRVRQVVALEGSVREKVVKEILAKAGSSKQRNPGVLSDREAREILRPYLPPKEETAQGESGGRSRQGAKIARALSELRHILETYDLPGYVPPDDVVEITGAKIEK
jgi:hypothetical protein